MDMEHAERRDTTAVRLDRIEVKLDAAIGSMNTALSAQQLALTEHVRASDAEQKRVDVDEVQRRLRAVEDFALETRVTTRTLIRMIQMTLGVSAVGAIASILAIADLLSRR
jgi:hypothetical protein